MMIQTQQKIVTTLFLLVLALAPLALSACGPKKTAESTSGVTEVKVAFWGSPEEIEIVTGSIKDWRESHPEIKIRFEHTPYSGYDSKILTRIAGGAAPDVIAAEVNYFVTFATRNVFTRP
jgi:multiple sugar transport system substrate-binding protein